MFNLELYRELDALPTLATGQADDLKLDSRELDGTFAFPHGADGVSVWTDRTEPGRITSERLVAGRWVPGDDDDILAVVACARFAGAL